MNIENIISFIDENIIRGEIKCFIESGEVGRYEFLSMFLMIGNKINSIWRIIHIIYNNKQGTNILWVTADGYNLGQLDEDENVLDKELYEEYKEFFDNINYNDVNLLHNFNNLSYNFEF